MSRVPVSPMIKGAGIALLLAQGIIHLYEAPEMAAEVPYLGLLFVLTLAGAIVAGVGIARDEAWGWLLGLLTAGGPLLGYVLSRSVGIPMLRETEVASVLEPLGVACVAVEALFVIIAGKVLIGSNAPAVAAR